MGKKDISYYNEDAKFKFNFRVAVIANKDNKILLQKCDKDPYYYLIGGRVSLGESTLTAVKREVEEETGIVVKNGELNLINIVENFFVYNGVKFHELLFIYKLNNKELLEKDDFKTLDKENSYNVWIDIDKLNELDVRPEIIKDTYNSTDIINTIIGE